jgi:hypothetical protein
LIAFNVQVVIIKGPLIVGEIVHIISGKGRRGKPKLLKCQYPLTKIARTLRPPIFTIHIVGRKPIIISGKKLEELINTIR